ncbi:MAG: DUF7345 domain-containing protein [Natronomonas sp.]
MNRTFAFGIFLCSMLVGVTILASGVAIADTGSIAAAQEEMDPDDVVLSIDIEADGDAVWEIEYRTRLETDTDEQAFDELAADVEANSSDYESQFRDRMVTTADAAESATGREMDISDVTVKAERRELPQEYGVVTYHFRWRNFAAVDDERLRVGDAIDGMFLDEDTVLRISWPDGYELAAASPSPDETRDGSVIWSGPEEFGSGEPRVTLEPEGILPSISPWLLAGAVIVVIVVVGGIVGYRRRPPGSGEGAIAGTPPASTGERTSSGAEDEVLLSNEEQVLQLLKDRGGRMKQQEIAEELGWTDAKTSQVTKGLREEGELEGFRLGRENVLSLPDLDDK